jgi:hypothetical protein
LQEFKMSELDSSFDGIPSHLNNTLLDADLEIANEINDEAISEIEIDQRLHF